MQKYVSDNKIIYLNVFFIISFAYKWHFCGCIVNAELYKKGHITVVSLSIFVLSFSNLTSTSLCK